MFYFHHTSTADSKFWSLRPHLF